MRYIDAFNHFFPKPLWDAMQKSEGAAKGIGARMQGIPAIYDLDERFKVMDQFSHHDYSQIISLGMPPLEALGPPGETEEFARLGNDGMAELVAKHPDYFAGFLASLPMNSPNAADEAERAFRDLGANGLQIHTNINGQPLDDDEFFAVFEMANRYNKPVLLHPSRGASMPDYASEDKSKYEIWWTFGWPYETSVALARLVFSGMMDKLPDLKVLAHHMGAMIPFFEGRIGPGWDQLGKRTTDEDYAPVLAGLKKRPFEYFKDFYADTATFGSRPAAVCGIDFFGADHVLFASDSPFDPERGPGYIRDTIKVLESIDMSKEDYDKICYKNAQSFFGLKKD